MQNPNLSDTQPTRVVRPERKSKRPTWLLALLFLAVIGGAVTVGAWGGFLSARETQRQISERFAAGSLDEQFVLGVQDLEAGRYEIAKQRFEFILQQDPQFPGAMDQLTLALQVLHSTATPTALAPTITPTPTRDPRPAEELFNQANQQINAEDWDGALETLIALRKENPTYQTARVDGMMYLALRHRGVRKISLEGNLGGGLYDLSLAESFGPLDGQAEGTRELARLFMIGLSFWGVHPEQAVFYFSQVAAAAPSMRDASGWTASDRYHGALIQYGDLLASQNAWCEASAQYELALTIRPDGALQEKFNFASAQCLLTTITPSPSPTASETLTVTQTTTALPGVTVTATATQIFPESATPTATTGAGTTATPTATATPTTMQTGKPTATTQAAPPTPTPTFTATPPQGTPYPDPSAGYNTGASWATVAITPLMIFALFAGWNTLLSILRIRL